MNFFSAGDGPVSERVAGTAVDVALLALARPDLGAQPARRGVHPLPRAGPRRDPGVSSSTVPVAGEPSRAPRQDVGALMTRRLDRERARVHQRRDGDDDRD